MGIGLSAYCFTLLAEQQMRLPEYLGSTLRGGFGHTFRRICCATAQRDCKACPLGAQCPYALLFESSPPPDSPALRNLEEIPRPFVIEPPEKIDSPLPAGSNLSFGLTLIGQARDFLPYFIVAFRELGADGLGRDRGKFRLDAIQALDPLRGQSECIYAHPEAMVRNRTFALTLEDCCQLALSTFGPDPTSLKILFRTPTRLKYEGHYVDRTQFHILFRSLLRRLSSLSLFHCGEKLEIDYRGLIAAAEQVRLVCSQTGWHDWERYSSRQRERMAFGGIVGEAEYESRMAPFLPFLLFGQWTHVGKNATFGLGRYEVRPSQGDGP